MYTANFTINQLEILPGNQMKTAREYAVSFRDLSAGSAPAVLGVELPEADGDPIPEPPLLLLELIELCVRAPAYRF